MLNEVNRKPPILTEPALLAFYTLMKWVPYLRINPATSPFCSMPRASELSLSVATSRMVPGRRRKASVYLPGREDSEENRINQTAAAGEGMCTGRWGSRGEREREVFGLQWVLEIISMRERERERCLVFNGS